MICIKTKIPKEIYEIDDELKAIYHSHDSICIWVFKTLNDRNKFLKLIYKKKPQLKVEVKNVGAEGFEPPTPWV